MPPKKNIYCRKDNKLVRCVRCSIKLKEPFQLLFDETGVDLELPKLLLTCFSLDVKENQDIIQALCEDCLNQLIEAFDIIQKNSQEEPKLFTSARNTLKVSVKKEEDEHEESLQFQKRNVSEVQLNEVPGEYKMEILDWKEIIYDQDYESDNSKKSEKILEEDESFEQTTLEHSEVKQTSESQKIANDSEEFEHVDYLDEYDEKIDFKEYKSKVLRSKFLDIVFPEYINCRICSDTLNKHVDIIVHTQKVHCVDDFAYPCVIDESCEPLESATDLSFHLVFKHYDLEALVIYSHCPECNRRFNDYMSYNKHSCYRGDKISRSAIECEICSKTFKSNKRYRFHQQFHQEKRRPKACLICDKLFRDEDEFYEHIMYSHEKDLGFVCVSCDCSFTSAKNLKNHENIHKIYRPYRCKVCNKSYLYNQLLNDHMLSIHGKSLFECHICGKSLVKKTLLNKHILSHNKPQPAEVTSCSICGLVINEESQGENHLKEHEESDDEPTTKTEVLEIAYCCEYCELAYNSIDNMFEHRKLHNKKEYYCDMCPLSYDQYKKLKTHKLTHLNYVDKRSTFPVLRYYVCDAEGCTMSYLQWTSLRSHKRHKHNDMQTFKCPKCSETYKNAELLKNHMENAHKGAAYECEFCDKTFGTRMALAVHISRRHNTSRFRCEFCDQSYATETLLEKHKDSVHNTFTCEICGKVLKNLKNYHVHQRMVHQKEKRFFCKFCNRGYFNNCDKIDHEKSVHEKIKKYKCDLCPYAAVYKESLRIHMRAHRNETPYVCSLCGKGFRRSYALELHTRRHYDFRDFKCPYTGCKSSYPNQGILNSHIRSKHQNSDNMPIKRKNAADVVIRSQFLIPPADIFIDDDDGLDDGVIGEPQCKKIKTEEDENSLDDPTLYISQESDSEPAVIVLKNESDHDYIVRLDENKIYGNIIEEYKVEDEYTA